MQTQRKRPLIIGFVLLMAVSAIWPTLAIIDLIRTVRGYPYASDDPATTSPLGFTHRSDADYVAWAVSQTQITLHGRAITNDWDGGQAGLGEWGEPAHWSDYALSLGFTVDHHAAAGAVAEWTTPDDSGRRGHVAMVTRAWPDGRIDVEEYDLPSDSNGHVRHAFGQRSGLPPADVYIHLERPLPGGIWDPATTASGSVSGDATIVVEAYDNGNGGLDHVAVTASEETGDGWSSWQPVRLVNFGGTPDGEVVLSYSRPPSVACVRLSFDVFSRNRSTDGSMAHQLSPSGLRHYWWDGHSCPTR